jgi:hypothetical protein
MITALVLVAAVAAQPGPPPTVAPELGRFTYSAMSLEEGVAQFRAICLEPLLDSQAIERAVLASGLGYARDDSVAAGEWLWKSRYGSVYFRSNSAMTDGRRMQDCNVRFIIPRRFSQRELANRVGRLLAPGRPRTDVELSSIWDLGGNYTDRIEMDGWAPFDSRAISLNRRHIYPGRVQETPR